MNETPSKKNNYLIFIVEGRPVCRPLLVSLRHFPEWHIGHSLRMHFETASFCFI